MRILLVSLVLGLVTFGQLVIKHGTAQLGPMPVHSAKGIVLYAVHAFMNPWIVSGFAAAFLSAIAWMAAVSKFEMSSTYPFLSLNFIIVPLLSILLFGEAFNWAKVAGCLLIVVGVFVFSRGIS